MSFAAPLALWLSGLALAIIALYILKVRRRRVTVPYLRLWESLLHETRARTLFKRLKRLLSLLLQLLIFTALLFAIARPEFRADALKEKQVVLVLDVSASMHAKEASLGTRFDLMMQRARGLVEDRRAGDEMMIVAASDRVDVLSPFNKKTLLLREALAKAHPTNRSLDVAGLSAFVSQVTRGRGNAWVAFLSDGNAGALGELCQRNDRFVLMPIGEARENVGITRFSTRKNLSLGTDYVLASVKNYGSEPHDFNLQVTLNGMTRKMLRKTLAPGAEDKETFQLALPEGGTLRLHLELDDALALDNTAYAIVKPHRVRRIVLVTEKAEEALPFKVAFESMREVVDESSIAVTLDEYESLAPEERAADITICVNVLPGVLADQGSLILLNTPAPSFLGMRVIGEEASPAVWDWDRDHLLNRYLNYRDLPLPKARKIALDSGTPIVQSYEGPLIAAFELSPTQDPATASTSPGRHVVYVGFDVTASLFPFRVAFPMLLRNSIAWFEVEDETLFEDTYAPGRVITPARRLSVDRVQATFFEQNQEQKAELLVEDGSFLFERTDEIGPYRFTVAEREYGTCVNLFDARESSIVVDEVPPPEQKQLPIGRASFLSGEPWALLALAALLVWALEWALYHRRITE